MVPSQTNLAEMKRIYLYFTGKTQGLSLWISNLKALFPEAKRSINGAASYEFDPDKIWAVVSRVESWRPMIEKQRINDFWELSFRVTPENEKWIEDYSGSQPSCW